jgi:galactofuranose transport system permease protein
MMQSISTAFNKNRRFLPLTATILLFCLAYALGAASYPGMRDAQVFITLFITTPFLLISAVGETFVIISGGIDLSVAGVVALTATASAALLRAGWNPWLVILLMLLMGMAIGAIMGGLITFMKVQPFIATLAGLWFTRGMCYIISDAEIRIHNNLYKLLAGTRIFIPGFSDVVARKGDFISPLVVLSVGVFLVALFIAHYTKFGRTIYSMGGNNGANEQSARLMGLPVDRTKVLVYTFNGLCSALAGIAYSIYVGSGHGTHAWGFEMTVIAAVVIGGTMLTGGEGYVFGTLFGVLITALIQTLIQFNGKLSSWWTSIAIGVLTLVFIGVQGLLNSLNNRQLAGGGSFAFKAKKSPAELRRQYLMYGGVGVTVIVAIVLVVLGVRARQARIASGTNGVATPQTCTLKPFREDLAASFIKDGAVLTYERNGGIHCVDEVYAFYADGRIVADNGVKQLKKQVTPEQVEKLLADINNLGWFTNDMYSSHHTPCPQCFTYNTTVTYNGQTKTVQAVDGGTDAPSEYWIMSGEIIVLVPSFETAP